MEQNFVTEIVVSIWILNKAQYLHSACEGRNVHLESAFVAWYERYVAGRDGDTTTPQAEPSQCGSVHTGNSPEQHRIIYCLHKQEFSMGRLIY